MWHSTVTSAVKYKLLPPATNSSANNKTQSKAFIIWHNMLHATTASAATFNNCVQLSPPTESSHHWNHKHCCMQLLPLQIHKPCMPPFLCHKQYYCMLLPSTSTDVATAFQGPTNLIAIAIINAQPIMLTTSAMAINHNLPSRWHIPAYVLPWSTSKGEVHMATNNEHYLCWYATS